MKSEKIEKKERIDTDTFIRILAEKCDYTIKDTETFLIAFTELIRECVENNIGIDIRHFGKLYVADMPQRKGFKPVPGVTGAGESMVYPPAKRVVFRLSGRIRDIVKNK